jgi:phosphoribosyl 1,2-cyclic phosphodiesterase
MKARFWGVRGSLPVPGKNTVKYGGNTSCLQIVSKNGEEIIVDAGTGIYNLGKKLKAAKYTETIHLFLTHFHWDHIQGMPFFAPFFDSHFDVKIYYYEVNGVGGRDVLDSQLNPKFFPITWSVFSSKVEFVRVNDLDEIIIDGIRIEKTLTHHSSGTVSYKFTEDDKTLVFMTDNELYCRKEEMHPTLVSICDLNSDLLAFAHNADALIHDTQYFEHHFSEKLGWGHSNNAAVAYFAHGAKVKNLYLYHYDPDHSDNLVDKLYEETRRILTEELNSEINLFASREGMEFEL